MTSTQPTPDQAAAQLAADIKAVLDDAKIAGAIRPAAPPAPPVVGEDPDPAVVVPLELTVHDRAFHVGRIRQ